jgi:hypothetical protein
VELVRPRPARSPSPVSSCVHAHVSDATPYQHATTKLAALLRFFSASCRGTPAVVPVRLRNVVPKITLPLRTIDVVRFSPAKVPACDLVQAFMCSVSPSSSTSRAKLAVTLLA